MLAQYDFKLSALCNARLGVFLTGEIIFEKTSHLWQPVEKAEAANKGP